jgi:hypothetical protein
MIFRPVHPSSVLSVASDLMQPPLDGQDTSRAGSVSGRADPFDPADRPSASDLFLSPHPDDICFSLGALAFRRRAGTLLTVFSRSSFLAPSQAWRVSGNEGVSGLRRAEDAAFATACGLSRRELGLEDAMARGRRVFDLAPLAEDAAWLAPLLHAGLETPPPPPEPRVRPWLFCPAGIGGHLDHVLLRLAVAGNIETLMRSWRVCFYEDLHYASAPMDRFAGLHHLTRALPGFKLTRRIAALGGMTAKKIELMGLYGSQFDVPPASISGYTPAVNEGAAPHEAVWVLEDKLQSVVG